MCRKNIKSFNDKKYDYKTHVSYKNTDIQNFVIKANNRGILFSPYWTN